MKTEYRIVSYHGLVADVFLQFKTIKRVRKYILFGPHVDKVVWRFIPDGTMAKIVYAPIKAEDCPTKLDFLNDAKYVGNFLNQNWHEIDPFLNQWPDINKYFDHLQEVVNKYFERKQKDSEELSKYPRA